MCLPLGNPGLAGWRATAPPLECLRATGDIQGAAAAWDGIPAALPLEDGEEAPSVILERLRSDER
jgi:hypothetical protein